MVNFAIVALYLIGVPIIACVLVDCAEKAVRFGRSIIRELGL